MKISLMAAMSKNRVIGNKGSIPWNMPADMKFFREKTENKVILMGRKTYESLPIRPLPNRTNLILTRDINYRAEGAIVVNSIEQALKKAEKLDANELMVIGGSEIYKEFLQVADKIYLTVIDAEIKGDAFFPELGSEWKEISRDDRKKDEENSYNYSFIILSR
jgi:dihydrofolate reductase